jgi:signal transduction histidine kinase
MAAHEMTRMNWQLFEHFSEGVVIVTPDGSVHYVNPAGLQLFGLSVQDNGRSLSHISQLLTNSEKWPVLSNPPAEMTLSLENGRTLNLQSYALNTENGRVIQILIQPANEQNHSDAINVTVEQLTALTQANQEPELNQKLQLLVNGLQTIGWNRVVLSLRDKEFNPTTIITAGFQPEEEKYLPEIMIPGRKWLNFFADSSFAQFKNNTSYFIPGDSQWMQENLPGESKLAGSQPAPNDPNAWHPKDILCVPLVDNKQTLIGLLSVDQPENGRRPGKRSLQVIELYAQFASSVIENALLIQETLTRSREMEILFSASSAITGMLDRQTMISRVGQHMLKAAQAEEYTFYQWHRAESKLTVMQDFVSSPEAKPLPEGTPFDLGDAFQVAQVLSQQEPIAVHILGNDPNLLRMPSWVTEKEESHYLSILIPIIFSDETFGIVELFCRGRMKPMTDAELQLLKALANQMGTALETTLLFEDTFERERFYNALGNVSIALNMTMDPDSTLDLVCTESRRIFEADGAYLWQRDGDYLLGSRAQGPGANGFGSTAVSIEDPLALVAAVARRAEAIYLPEFPGDTEWKLHLPSEENVTAVLGIPLEHEGNLIGVLLLTSHANTRKFSEKDISRGTIFGVQVANALQNARLFAELQALNEDLDNRVEERTRALNEESSRVKILLRITTELSASLDEDHVFTQALHLVNEVVHASQGVILLIDPDNEELIFRAGFGMDRPISPKGEPSGMYRHEGLAGWMIENRAAVIVGDTLQDERWIYRDASKEHRSVLGVPLITNDEVIGVLMMFHPEPQAFTMQQLDLVEAAAIQVANAINNANLYRFISEQANRLGSMLRAEQIESAKNQAILESIADGVLVADDNSRIILANKPVSDILDIPRKQLLGKSVHELLGLYGHSGDSWIHTIEEWANNPKELELGTTLSDELKIEEKYVSVRLSPVLAGHQFFGTVSIFRDITKEVEVDRLKTEFVSTVSHELRTPMTSIKGYADLLLMGAVGQLTDPQQRYMQVIKNNANRLHMLVNDLLDISRIETGKTTLELRPLDMTQLVEQVVNGHINGRIQHEGKQITIQTHFAPALPLVNGDHQRVTQILTNLLDNAVNYTPNQGEIHIFIKTDGQMVYTSIQDTGIGIAPENLEKIFDRFYRAEDAEVQKVPGTGLGLAIVRSLVEKHDGTLTVESTLGEGSTFTFSLPVVQDEVDTA